MEYTNETAIDGKTIAAIYKNPERYKLNPNYQRKIGVWSLQSKQDLINSLLDQCRIGLLSLEELQDQDCSYAIIDGLQRFSTIMEYLNDKFALSKDFKLDFAKYKNPPLPNQKYSELSSEAQQAIHNTIVYIERYINCSSEFIHTAFRNLNSGYPLNDTEQHQAIISNIGDIAKQKINHPFAQMIRPIKSRGTELSILYFYLNIELTLFKSNNKILFIKRRAEQITEMLDQYNNLGKKECVFLSKQLKDKLDKMEIIFKNNKHHLKRKNVAQTSYLFLNLIQLKYIEPDLLDYLNEFINTFYTRRNKKLKNDHTIDAFKSYVSYGTLEARSQAGQCDILLSEFHKQYPHLKINPEFHNIYTDLFTIKTRRAKKKSSKK